MRTRTVILRGRPHDREIPNDPFAATILIGCNLLLLKMKLFHALLLALVAMTMAHELRGGADKDDQRELLSGFICSILLALNIDFFNLCGPPPGPAPTPLPAPTPPTPTPPTPTPPTPTPPSRV